jgi:dihydropteroate synthase
VILSFDKPLLMGILNITPDSFSDGGKYLSNEEAVKRVDEMWREGADIIDIGAESTFGPEAQVSAEEEWGRLEPILKSLAETQDLASLPVISVDTWKADVVDKALELGVHMINDVTALRGDPKMIEVLLKYQPYVCLMYSAYDTAYAGRENIQYDDVIKTIKEFLDGRTKELTSRGFPKEKILIDPGLGFFLSADPKYSWEVIERLEELKSLGFSILIGPSMKSFLGGEIKDRLPMSLEAAKKCLENGASVLRVHHVKEHSHLFPFRPE